MEGKDDRSKNKRRNMKVVKRKMGYGGKEDRGAIVDVADSSDDRFVGRQRSGWISAVPPQQRRDSGDLSDHLEDDDDDSAAAQRHAGDFNILAQLPTTGGGYFQFASEKNWEGPVDADGTQQQSFFGNTEASEYFTLNLKLLNAGLQTIPFYKRMDYPSSLFTKEQIVAMEKAAEAAETKYQAVLREHVEKPTIKLNSAGSRKSVHSAKSQAPVSQPLAASMKDELDDLLSIATTQVAKVALNVPPDTVGATEGVDSNTPATKKDDDIQQWLDNVLEE